MSEWAEKRREGEGRVKDAGDKANRYWYVRCSLEGSLVQRWRSENSNNNDVRQELGVGEKWEMVIRCGV